MITKSDFLKYKECSSFFWFWKNEPKVLSEEKVDPFIERLKLQGYQVEIFARNLYPNAVLVTGSPENAAYQTRNLLSKNQNELFQASFLVDGLFVSCDILIWNDLLSAWDLIEVKSSTDKGYKKDKRKEHILDAAFQRVVIHKSGLKIANVYLLELNKEFFKDGEIDPIQIFNTTEITSQCIEMEQGLLADIEHAKELLQKAKSQDCSCKYKGRSRHCGAFNHLYPNVPAYSIYDLRAIGSSKKVLRSLVDNGHLVIDDISDEVQLNQKHSLQRYVTQTKDVVFEKEIIKAQFDKLQYPLYFLDYETLACGIPKFDNTYPYQQTVFQYSLHILHASGQVSHKEYIHRDQSTPVHTVAEKLREDIGDVGHVIVWNKGFEGKCNQDLANVNPDLESFLLDLNVRIFDLMEIFRRMEYLHDDFKGSYSIKNVLPVICPDLSYDGLQVSNGADAVVVYEDLIFGSVKEEDKEQKFNDLLEYCKLDTWAMVRIFKELRIMIKY